MKKPVRLQLSRKKGFNLQRLSVETNGLSAVVVSRPSKWGNPFPIRGILKFNREQSIKFFRRWLLMSNNSEAMTLLYSLDELKGKNLACFCKLREKCHADVLLKIAND